MKTLNAIDSRSATCIATVDGVVKPWVVADVKIRFNYVGAPVADNIYNYPVQVMQGGTCSISLLDAPTASIGSVEYAQTMRFRFGKGTNAAAIGDITLKGCMRESSDLRATPSGEGAWVLEGGATYTFMDVSHPNVGSFEDNSSRGWYF